MLDSVFRVRGPAHVLIKGGLIDSNCTQNVPSGNRKKGFIKSV